MGRSKIIYRSPVDLYIDEWIYELLEETERIGAKRVLIDSLTDLQHAAGDEVRFREYMYSLTQRFSRAGVSLMMTSELPTCSRSPGSPNTAVSHLSDNVLLLQYIRDGAAHSSCADRPQVPRHRQTSPEVREFTIDRLRDRTRRHDRQQALQRHRLIVSR